MAIREDEWLRITSGRRKLGEVSYNILFAAGLLAISAFDLILWIFNRRLE